MDARKYKFDVPIQRYANPEEVANLITFAASDEASFVSGSAIMVDGDLTAV